MELLEKGLAYQTTIKNLSSKLITIIFGLIALLGIWLLKISFEYSSSSIRNLGLFIIIFSITFPMLLKQYFRMKINEIDKKTHNMESFSVEVQIISKSKESTTNISDGYGTTYHKYIVGVRDSSGRIFTVNSKELYMGAVEGEYIDILIKRKLDINGNILDSAAIPLMNSIRTLL